MRNSGSYQLVSEHSILSAQRDNRVAAMEKFLEKTASHSKPEWKEEIYKIRQRLERRRSRCDELSEKDFEIYLEMKLQWLQRFYVAANSTKSEKRSNEPEEEGWNENSEEELKFQKLDVMVNHQNQKKEEEPVSIITKSEEESSQKRHIDEWREEILSDLEHEGSVYCPPLKLEDRMDVAEQRVGVVEVTMKKILKQLDEIDASLKDLGSKMKKNRERGNDGGRGDEIGDERELPQEQVKIGTHGEKEPLTEEPPPEPPDCDMFKAAVGSFHDLCAEVRYCSDRVGDKECNGEEEEEMTRRNDGTREGRRDVINREDPPELPSGGGTMAEVPPVRDASTQTLVPVTEWNKAFGKEKEAWVGWSSRKLDLMYNSLGQAQYLLFTPTHVNNMECVLEIIKEMCSEKKNNAVWRGLSVGLTSHSMGQAQVQVSKSEFYMEREVLKEKTEMEKKWFGFGWFQKKGNFTFNPMGQTHNFIIAPAIFTNSGGVFQVEKRRDQKKLIEYDWAQNLELSMNFKADVGVFGFVGDPKMDVDVSATVLNREATILYILLKNAVEGRAFGQGGSFSISCITWSSCFKLWDPGGRLLIVCF